MPANARSTLSAPDNEAALVAAARKRDPAAFTELVRRYERRVFRLVFNITQNHEDAEDALQDAFLKAYKNLNKFEGNSRFYTWLVRIAVNEALMKLRKRRPNHFSLDAPLATEDDFVPVELEDWGPSPEQRYEQVELREILETAVAQLDAGYRVVFLLRDVEQLSTEETAKLLGLSVPAAKTRLLRARLQLRQLLSPIFAAKPEHDAADVPLCLSLLGNHSTTACAR